MAKDIFRLSNYSRAKALKKARLIIQPVLTGMINEYANRLERSTSISDSIINSVVTDKKVRDMLEKVYKEIAPNFAKGTFEAINQGKIKADFAQTAFLLWLDNWIKQESSTKIVSITETTREQIKLRLAKAAANGLSIPDTAKLIKNELLGINKRRAVSIARTEVISSSNAASLQGAKMTGVNVLKIWIPTISNRTRGSKPTDKFDHIDMTSHPPIELDKDFNVSGESLSYPGDFKGSAGNVINCRCSIGYVRPK